MSDETTRLRALLEGTALPWKVRPLMKGKSHPAIVEDGDGDTVTPIHIGHTSMERSDAHVALIVAAVNALPGLLDAAERAERAEARELEAIIAGRTTPPTDAEIEAHDAAGGRWRTLGVRGFGLSLDMGEIGDARLVMAAAARSRCPRVWWPLDADGRPCAWPTAEVSR